jgi:hypothetical protein
MKLSELSDDLQFSRKVFGHIIRQIFSGVYVKIENDYSALPIFRAKLLAACAKKGERDVLMAFKMSGQNFSVEIYSDFQLGFDGLIINDNVANPNIITDIQTKIADHYKNNIKPRIVRLVDGPIKDKNAEGWHAIDIFARWV